MVPASFVIGDDLLFRADNVKAARSPYAYLPAATLTYSLVHSRSRTEITSGSMSVYDSDTASFEASISRTLLGEYDADTNPTGIRPRDHYTLRVTVESGGKRTTKAAELEAVQDPDSSFEAAA